MTEEKALPTSPSASQPETPTPQTDVKPAAPAWTDVISSVSAEDLRRHPLVAGIIGSEIQRARQLAQQETKDQAAKDAAEKAERDLLELARTDSEAFAERYISDKERQKLEERVTAAERRALERVAKSVGISVTKLPEWAELTQDEYQRLTSAVQDKTEDEAIPAYNQTVLDILAERRATKKLAKWREDELAKEREAIRAEERAKNAAGRPAPSVRQGSGPSPLRPSDIDNMSDADFNKWFDKNVARR